MSHATQQPASARLVKSLKELYGQDSHIISTLNITGVAPPNPDSISYIAVSKRVREQRNRKQVIATITNNLNTMEELTNRERDLLIETAGKFYDVIPMGVTKPLNGELYVDTLKYIVDTIYAMKGDDTIGR